MYHGFDWYGRTLEVREVRYLAILPGISEKHGLIDLIGPLHWPLRRLQNHLWYREKWQRLSDVVGQPCVSSVMPDVRLAKNIYKITNKGTSR